MARILPLIILLQAFCIYHAYSRQSEQKWYWIIALFPFLGSLMYLYTTFYSRSNLDNLTEEVKINLVKNYKIDSLEKQVAFSDTVVNKLDLAEEHIKVGNYHRALELYESCNQGFYSGEPDIVLKLIQINHYLNRYDEVIKNGEELEGVKVFKNSNERIALAMAYNNVGNSQKAEEIYMDMDTMYTNYNARLEYASFLLQSERRGDSKNKINELLHEFEMMNPGERRPIKSIIKEIKYFSNVSFK